MGVLPIALWVGHHLPISVLLSMEEIAWLIRPKQGLRGNLLPHAAKYKVGLILPSPTPMREKSPTLVEYLTPSPPT